MLSHRPKIANRGCAPMGGCILWHLGGLHPQGVVFQAFSTIAFSSPCHWLSNAPPFGGGQLERVGSHHGFRAWPPFKFASPQHMCAHVEGFKLLRRQQARVLTQACMQWACKDTIRNHLGHTQWPHNASMAAKLDQPPLHRHLEKITLCASGE